MQINSSGMQVSGLFSDAAALRKAEYIMRCPYCGNPDTRVIDSRPAEDKSSIRRRRSCDECGRRFTTYEKVETIPLIVIKKDNNREQYQRSKIEKGILSACYKRPVPAEDIQKTIDAVELEIFNREEKEIPSSVTVRSSWRNWKILIRWRMFVLHLFTESSLM